MLAGSGTVAPEDIKSKLNEMFECAASVIVATWVIAKGEFVSMLLESVLLKLQVMLPLTPHPRFDAVVDVPTRVPIPNKVLELLI